MPAVGRLWPSDHDGGDVHDDGLDSWLDFPEEQLYTKTERGDDHDGHDGNGHADDSDDNSFILPKLVWFPNPLAIELFQVRWGPCLAKANSCTMMSWCLDISVLQVTMAEDSIGSPADLSRDDSSDLGGGSDSLRRRCCLYLFLFCISGNLLVTSICYFMLLLACKLGT